MSRATAIADTRSRSYYVNWNQLSREEKLVFENLVMVVGTLYNMCKVQLVKKGTDNKYKVNYADIHPTRSKAQDVIKEISMN